MQNKVTTKGPLLNEKGELVEKGYSNTLIKTYQRSQIKAKKFKIKEWDYYLVYNKDYAVCLTIDDNSYMGLLSASVIDFNKKIEKTTSLISFFTNSKTNMPQSSEFGDVTVKKKNIYISFRHENNKRILELDMKKFTKESSLKCYFELTNEPLDSIVMLTPFPENKKAFYYNQKIVGFSAQGAIEYNNQKLYFSKSDTRALLDWGRGVWTYKNVWYWGSGAGVIDGKEFGLNIGYGFGDTSSASENAVFYDQKIHKLSDVTFNIPLNEKNKEDYLKKWTFTSSDNRLYLEFSPIIDRKSCTNIGIICSDQHQVFGKANGYVILDDATKIEITDFTMFAEKVFNKW